MDQLIALLKKIEKQNYRSYQTIKGSYDFGDFELFIDSTQADPFAPASRVRAFREWSLTGLEWLKDTSPEYQRAARDFIARSFSQFAHQENSVFIAQTGQTVLDHTSVIFTEKGIELRFRVDLPADGRTILGKKAINILTFYLPKFIRKSTIQRELNLERLKQHCETIEDQVALRNQLSKFNLMAFVGNGSILPRKAGNSDLPMSDAVTFESPDSMLVELDTPHSGKIKGMGIPKGITLIVGGGFHGKSTLLNAVERSIYDHIPGDGRERIVAEVDAIKIRAEDGRCVHNLNLSNYINHLPQGRKTDEFSTQDASGSTSQAAWLQESIESGASSLLIDEDTSATNFMIRDERMQALVSKGEEPITPLVDRIGLIRDELNISTLIVMGGSGDYLDVADTVIQMHNYQAVDVTDKAKEVISLHPNQRIQESTDALATFSERSFNSKSLQAILSEGKFRVGAKGKSRLRFGKEQVDLQALEQIESESQINAIGWVWFQFAQLPNWSKFPVKDLKKILEKDNWFDTMPNHGDLAKPRVIDVMAALNRMRQSQFKAAK